MIKRNTNSGVTYRRRFTIALVAFAALCTGASSALANDKWVGTWASAQQGVNTLFGGVAPVFTDQTLRQIVQVSVGGSTLRVRVSNVLGAEQLTIDAASVAKSASGAAIEDGTQRKLTFSGSESVTLSEGAYVLSDPVSLDVNAFDNLAISIYLEDETTVATHHSAALQTNYVSTAGNFTGSVELPVESMNESWFLLSGVDVMASSDTKVVVAFGDSITDGTSSTADTNNRYPSLLAKRIAADVDNVAVLNMGIAGNRVLHNAIGPNALSRFDRDVIARPGVTHVILLEGINDIGLPGLIGATAQEVTVDQIVAGYQQLIQRAHSHDIRVIGATLMPYKTAIYYSEEGELKRGQVNDWIRSSDVFDGIVDLDLAMRDPENPLQLLPLYDSGDNLHPSDTGYQALADAIDLSLLGLSVGSTGGELSAVRHDARQGEIVWQQDGSMQFNVYRDQVLQTPSPINASSFYQNTLTSGQSYLYEVVRVDMAGTEINSLGSVSMPAEDAFIEEPTTNAQLTGQRYDDTQAELFWDKQGFTMFRVYRDGVLVTPDDSFGSSFYQSDLLAGQAYLYQVNGVDSEGNETSIGQLIMPATAGSAAAN